MTKLIHLVAVLGCALVSLAPALAADKDLQAGGMWAKILGQSGKIDLAPSSDVSSNPDKVRIQIEALRQLDKDGAELGKGGNSQHSFNSFATQEFTFSPLEDTTFGGVKCIKLPFSCTLGPGSKIEIQVFIFKEKGTITLGEEKFPVTNKTMKFNVLLSSWVWCTGTGTPACQGKDGVGASVEIDISVTSKEQAKQLSTGNVYSMGGGAQMRLSKKIQLEGSASAWTDMPGGGPSLTGTGTTSKFTLKFPKFTTSALYDPDITYSTSSTTSTGAVTAATLTTSKSSSSQRLEGRETMMVWLISLSLCCLSFAIAQGKGFYI